MEAVSLSIRNVRLITISFLLLVAVIFTGCGGKTETPEIKTPGASSGTTAVTGESNMKLSSSAFENNGTIPVKYAHTRVAGGENISIPLEWQDAPAGTKSFALAMVDTSSRNWVHWMVINIPPDITSLSEGASVIKMPSEAKELANTFGSIGYGGPEPPHGARPHNYVTTIYALNVDEISLPVQSSYNDFLQAIEGKILAQARLTGEFSR
ncbi:MAG TPA: YbhB/YbcL family Raf kinase inhibitor-like protein [Anaerolineae bacterium]|nr:YbhB/YbcL family Raf kinase inhibitor-like protein [Anaerolineae bacterium]